MRKECTVVQLECDDKFFYDYGLILSREYDKIDGESINDKIRYMYSQKSSRNELMLINKGIGWHNWIRN